MKERKVYWTVEKAVWGAIKPVHYFFRNKENADRFAEQDYCGYPEKHTARPDAYDQIMFED